MLKLIVWKIRRLRLPCFAVLVLGLISGQFTIAAHGQNVHAWTNTSSLGSGWNLPVNWNPVDVPGPTDGAVFVNAGQAYEVFFSPVSPGGTVDSLQVFGAEQTVNLVNFFDDGIQYLIRAETLVDVDDDCDIQLEGVHLSCGLLEISQGGFVVLLDSFGSTARLTVDTELQIESGGSLSLQDGSVVDVDGQVVNSGFIIVRSGLSRIIGNVTNTSANIDSVDVEGQLRIEGSYNGGATATTSSTVDSTVVLAGDYHPGDAPGQQTDNVTFVGINLQLENSSETYIQLASATEFDQIVSINVGALTPNLTLDGGMTVELLNGYQPAVGQTFKIIDFQSSGTFDVDSGFQFVEGDVVASGPGFQLVINYASDGVTLVTQAAPPENDDFDLLANPVLGVSDTINASNVNASTEFGEPDLGNTGSTVWWSLFSSVDGTMTVDTIGSDFDTLLHVYEYQGGNVGDLVLVANNDDIEPGVLQSEVSFEATANTQYVVRVGGFTNGGPPAEGNIVLNSDFETSSPPSNDDFDFLFNPFIEVPQPTINATNVNATTETNEPDSTNTGSTVWWSINEPEGGTMTIDTIGSDFDTLLHVYRVEANNFGGLNLVTFNDDISPGVLQSEVSFELAADTSYSVRVGGFTNGGPAAQGSITMNVEFEPDTGGILGDVNCDGVVNLLDVGPFVDALSGGPFNPKADVNEDDAVNLLDVGPFVELLSGG